MAKHRKCGDCWHSEPKLEKKNKAWKLCFRYPPKQASKDSDSYSPEVHEDRRACGEFLAKSTAEAKGPSVPR